MNTKYILSTVIALAAVASAGMTVAQTSTPGAGCTATANAMRGGNLGGSATNKDCVTTPASTAAMPAPMTTTATPTPMAAPAPSTNTAAMPDSSMMASATPTRTRTRSAKADRN